MRILHLDAHREMGGGQWQALRLMQGLAAAGFENTLLAPRGSALLGLARQTGIDATELSWAAVIAQARKAALVHAHDARSHALAACPAGPRLVVSRRVAFPIRRNAASRWKYRRAAHYIAVSQHVKQTLEDAGIPAAKITVVHDGVPATPPAGSRNPDLVCHVAKGADLAREAALMAGVPLHVSRDLEADLPGARIFLYFTESEGLGSAALLAMAHGVPVIASRMGGLPEIVEDGRTGLLTANDPAEIARAIRTLIENPAMTAEMGRRAAGVVTQRFSVEQMVRGTILVYQTIWSKLSSR